MSMSTLVLALLLAAVLSFLCSAVQARVRKLLQRRPAMIWAVPFLLTAAFSGAAVLVAAWSLSLCLLMLAYTMMPVLCAWVVRAKTVAQPSNGDFMMILLIWLPVEFAAGARLVPR